MNSVLRVRRLWIILCAFASSVSAAVFQFEYEFGDGLTVSGTLNGTANGSFVESVTGVTLTIGGTAISGPIFGSQFDGSSYLAGPIVSFDVTQNNFFFATSDLAAGDFNFDTIFYIANANVFTDTALVYSTNGYASQDEPPPQARWTLSLAPTSSVPDESGAIPLAGVAVGTLCVWSLARRRYRHSE